MPQGGKQFVIRLERQGEGDAAQWVSRRTEVQLGVRRGGAVQIATGLKEGDTVVVAGQQKLLEDGTAVRVIDMGRPSVDKGNKGQGPGAPVAPDQAAKPAQ